MPPKAKKKISRGRKKEEETKSPSSKKKLLPTLLPLPEGKRLLKKKGKRTSERSTRPGSSTSSQATRSSTTSRVAAQGSSGGARRVKRSRSSSPRGSASERPSPKASPSKSSLPTTWVSSKDEGNTKELMQRTIGKLKEHLSETRDKQRITQLLRERMSLQKLVEEDKIKESEADEIVLEKAVAVHHDKTTKAAEDEENGGEEEEEEEEEERKRMLQPDVFNPYSTDSAFDVSRASEDKLVPMKIRFSPKDVLCAEYVNFTNKEGEAERFAAFTLYNHQEGEPEKPASPAK